MVDFWRLSGYDLLDHGESGQLLVTDAFLRAYLARPELRPVEDSGAGEIDLHERLMAEPRMPVSATRLAALDDTDAAENYDVFLRFRDWLVGAPSVEAAYLSLVRGDAARIPPLFVDHMVQIILRGILDSCEDPFRLRAAELLFRAQKVNIVDGAIMLADEETVETRATQSAGVALDVLNEDNLATYWDRDDQFDTVFNVNIQSFGQDALARVLEAWVDHFLAVRVSIQPVASIRDERWRWHVGLDTESTAILNDLYHERAVDEDRLARILALFRLEFKDPTVVLPEMADRPVYLGMAMTPDNRLRLKPQNLLANLPIAVTG